jgi:acyl-CoA thioester hydrolase
VRSETTVQLRWSDMDAMGHVNNATYLTYLETAREPWFDAFGEAEEYMSFAMRRVEVDFLSQLTFADGAVLVTIELAGVGVSSIRTSERMTAVSDGRLVVEARAVIVRLDETGLRSTPLPDGLRERLAGTLPA